LGAINPKGLNRIDKIERIKKVRSGGLIKHFT
jgi:hypothetical protein